MKAAVFREVNVPMEIEEVTVSKPGPREVLIRTKAAGICHSDMHFFNGSYPGKLPMVLGHESAGIVEQVGSDVHYVKPGDHVITCLSVFCGHCEQCLTGHLSLCQEPETNRTSDEEPRLSQSEQPLTPFAQLGSFAEMMLVHEHALVKVREDMPMDRAALIGCGGIGLSAINGAALAGASRIIAVDMVPSKLELARKFGATDLVDASDGEAVEKVKEMTGGGVHYSFEAIGLKATAEEAFRMLRAGGTATVIGMIPPGQMVSLHGVDFLSEKKIQGSMMGSNRFRVDMPRFVDFYLQGKLHLDDMISNRIALADINEGMAALETGEIARSVIMFD